MSGDCSAAKAQHDADAATTMSNRLKILAMAKVPISTASNVRRTGRLAIARDAAGR
jgi:hypothetical protein